MFYFKDNYGVNQEKTIIKYRSAWTQIHRKTYDRVNLKNIHTIINISEVDKLLSAKY